MLRNILFVNVAYPPLHFGGSGVNVKNIAYGLKEQGYSVTIFSGGTRALIEDINGIIVYRDKAKKQENSPWSISNYLRKDLEEKFIYILKKHHINIVHFNSIQGLGANLVESSLGLGIKTFLTMHDFWWMCPLLFLKNTQGQTVPILNHQTYCCREISAQALKKRNQYLFSILRKNALKVITVSQTVKKAFVYLKYPHAKNYTVIENGISPLDRKIITETQSSNKVIFGFLGGTDASVKGFHLLLGAARYLNTNSGSFEIRCYRVLDPLLKTVFNFRFLKKHHIKLYSTFDNSKVYSILSKIDCLLVPSQSFETFSMSAREALMAECILISSGMGGLSELKSPKHLLFNKNSSSALAEKMMYVMNNLKTLKSIRHGLDIKTVSDQIKSLDAIYQR